MREGNWIYRFRKVLQILLCALAITAVPAVTYADVHLMLDPGHGGDDTGADNPWGGPPEKNLNLKIGLYLKEELETKYDGVTVSMTRDDNSTLELSTRVNMANSDGADALISLHNNAVGDICKYTNGCTVLVSYSDYAGELTTVTQELGVNILAELEALGLENQGLLLRTSSSEYYNTGEKKDYYGIIRRGVTSGLPSIIIEHGFMDDEGDYETYLNEDEKLRALAEADARGIARYYRLPLKETGEPLEELANVETTKVLVSTGHWQDNEIWTETFFPKEIVETEAETETTSEPEYEVATEAATEAELRKKSIEDTNEESVEETEAIDHSSEEDTADRKDAESKGFRKGLLLGLPMGAIAGGVLAALLVMKQVEKKLRSRKRRTRRKEEQSDDSE